MVCYRCKKVRTCSIFQTLYNTSANFSINDCQNFDKETSCKYRKLAENDNLMRLIYDYFLGQLEVAITEEVAVKAIKRELLNL